MRATFISLLVVLLPALTASPPARADEVTCGVLKAALHLVLKHHRAAVVSESEAALANMKVAYKAALREEGERYSRRARQLRATLWRADYRSHRRDRESFRDEARAQATALFADFAGSLAKHWPGDGLGECVARKAESFFDDYSVTYDCADVASLAFGVGRDNELYLKMCLPLGRHDIGLKNGFGLEVDSCVTQNLGRRAFSGTLPENAVKVTLSDSKARFGPWATDAVDGYVKSQYPDCLKKQTWRNPTRLPEDDVKRVEQSTPAAFPAVEAGQSSL